MKLALAIVTTIPIIEMEINSSIKVNPNILPRPRIICYLKLPSKLFRPTTPAGQAAFLFFLKSIGTLPHVSISVDWY